MVKNYLLEVSNILITMLQWVEVSISDPKNFVPQRGVEPRPLANQASVITTRLPRITVTFTPPRRKHVLMQFELGDHIGHQMLQWVEVSISDPNNFVPQQGVEPRPFANRASVITTRLPRICTDRCHNNNIFLQILCVCKG